MIKVTRQGRFFTRVDSALGAYFIEDVYEALGVWIIRDEFNEEVYRTVAGLQAAIDAIEEVTAESLEGLQELA